MNDSIPSPATDPRPLSALLTDFQASLGGERVTLADVLEAFHERGFGVVLFILALPMALPVPVPPGINILLASPLILLTAQQAIGRHTIWLPESLKRRSISASGLRKTLDHAVPWTRRLEWLVRPRLGMITQGMFSHLIGFCGLLMALAICVPLPLTNTVPSLGIALMALGVVMRDGLAVLAGAAIGLLWIALLVLLGEAGLRLLLDMLL